MRLAGKVIRSGNYWAIEVPSLDVFTQGKTKKDAYAMVADAIESLVNVKGFRVDVYPGKGGYLEVGSKDQTRLVAFFVKRQRLKGGLSLIDAAGRLGSSSKTTFARYEQGKSDPTIQKLTELLGAVSNRDFVIGESEV